MFDTVIYLLAIITIYSILVGITAVTVVALEHLYCKCKPSYRFTDYIPTNIAAIILWPLILPLLLIELFYIATYCLTQKLRKLL
jgi:hypothetical protein